MILPLLGVIMVQGSGSANADSPSPRGPDDSYSHSELTKMDHTAKPLSHLAAVLECLLLTAEKPLILNRIAEIFSNQSPQEWQEAFEELRRHYDDSGHGIFVAEVAGGYQMRTRTEYASWIVQTRPTSPQRLSQAALETLAVIAYRQPIIRAEIETIRGVDVSGVLRQLLDKGLIQMLGRKDIPGRPILYGTSPTFLEVFGLKDLRSLPTQEELQALAEAELAGGSDFEPVRPTGPSCQGDEGLVR
jgi:segregation and condensation protein B